jgi:hypothetical protein
LNSQSNIPSQSKGFIPLFYDREYQQEDRGLTHEVLKMAKPTEALERQLDINAQEQHAIIEPKMRNSVVSLGAESKKRGNLCSGRLRF